MTIEQERKALQKELQKKRIDALGHAHEVPPLDMEIRHKRRVKSAYYEYEEWKIEYTVESPETMPIPSGQRVPAYLLIPRQSGSEAPFPAMAAFHQCGTDCSSGKEAVLGKVVYRPDQAYGIELVSEGFVVLAPDSVNCGERFVPGVRNEGETKHCWAQMDNVLGRPFTSKHRLDGIRAIDLLCSLDFVDTERIGAIGHSMGSGVVRDIMPYDSRVKACIRSSATPDEFLPLHAPRLHIALQGSLDGTGEKLKQVQVAYEHAKRFYEADGVPENLILKIHTCGHHFLDEFKWEAYAKLRQYFGMDNNKKVIPLLRIFESVRNSTAWTWKKGAGVFPEIGMLEHTHVIADEERLTEAFHGFFCYLFQKKPGTPLVMEVKENQNTITFICKVLSDTPHETAATKVTQEHNLRRAQWLIAGAGGSMTQEIVSDAIAYTITMPKV